MPSADQIRASQQAAWDGLAPGWAKWDAIIMDQLAPVSTAMIDALGIAADQHHLDIASGTGEPGLTIAARAPRGRSVLTDLSAEMLAIATQRAAALGLTDIETRQCSADDLPFADASFDSVSVRFGYMFFPDLATTTAQLVRVLRPGGRLCASVWAAPGDNPWTTLVTRAVAAETGQPAAPTDPDAPGMFRCAAPGRVGAVLAAAGLVDIREWDVPVELATRSPDEYWDMISEHVSLAVAALRRVDADARERIRTAVLTGVGAYVRNGDVRVPGLARCIVGTRPAA